MRRGRLVLFVFGGFVALVTVLLVAVFLGLPTLVKLVAINQGRTLLGRDVSIQHIELDVWNGWYRIKGLRIAGRPGEAPLLEIPEAHLRVRYRPLFREGQLRTSQFALVSPTVRLARLGPNQFSISDIIERFAPEEKKVTTGEATFEILADLITVSNGTILVEDRAVSPARMFEIKNLVVNLKDISTRLHTERGTGIIALVLNGSPMAVVAEAIRIRPAHVKATVNVVDFDVDEVWAYVPLAALAVRPARGRFSTNVKLLYDATEGARIDAETKVADLSLVREGQDEPLLWLPEVTVTARDIVSKDGTVSLGRLEVDTDLSVVDQTISPPRQYNIDDIRLVVENVAYPTGPPANLGLTMTLPENATLDVRGTVAPQPLAANLNVTLADLDLTLANPYIPPVAPFTIARGRLGAALTVAVAEGPNLRVNGDVTTGYALLRREQAEPLIDHPRVHMKITDLTWQPGAFALQRLNVAGPATIVDASVSPPNRVEFTTLTLQADDATWPVQRPVRLKSVAAVGSSGTARIEGTFNPATLAADVRATFADVDVTRAGAYVPRDLPVTIKSGRLGATLAIKNDRAAGVAINADGAVSDLGVAYGSGPQIAVTDRKLGFTVADVRVRDSALSIARAGLTGAPSIADDSVTPPRRLDLRGVKASVRDVAWPATRPLPLELLVDLPQAGTLTVAGSAQLDARAVTLNAEVKDAALAGYQSFLPFEAAIGGEASAAMIIAVRAAAGVTATVKGQAEVRNFALGAADSPAVQAERVETTGIDVQWPEAVRVDLVKLVKPSAVLEREKDGSFPLRTMLTPRGATEAPATPPVAPPAPPADAPAATKAPLAVSIHEVLIEDGNFRFIDRSTTPLLSEEISRVALKVANVTTAPGERADMTMQAVVGATGALDLTGQIAPTANPFYLDVQGELREFPLSNTNPYFRRVFDWFVKRGSISNKIHYRVVGDQVTAENQVRVRRLGVERDTSPVASDRKIGLPLGLIVAMVTDSRGDIEFSLPVSGNLREPGFTLGGAIWSALKNVLANMVTGPFRAVGKLFSKGDDVEELKVDPVTFAPGSASVSPDGDQHLLRVADFLRASPNINLRLRPVVTAADVATLKTAEVTARIQRMQREERLADFRAAAAKLFAQTFPSQAVPDTSEKIVERLRDQLPLPDGVALELATKRAEATRQALVQRGGVDGRRLGPAGSPSVGAEGQGRVEFELNPVEG